MFGGFMHGYWGLGWLIGLVLFVVFLLGLVFFIVWAVRRSQRHPYESQTGQQSSHPENILKERYARGEISREEFLSMIEDLKGR